MTSKGTYYDQVASIVPGTLWVLIAAWAVEDWTIAEWNRAGAGALAALAVGGFAVGYLMTHVGRLFSDAYWSLFGRPSDRARDNKSSVLPRAVHPAVVEHAKAALGIDHPPRTEEWQAYFIQARTAVCANGTPERMGVFLAQFAFGRALFLASAGFAIVAAAKHGWAFLGLGVAAAMLAFLAMRYFDRAYVREVFLLNLRHEN